MRPENKNDNNTENQNDNNIEIRYIRFHGNIEYESMYFFNFPYESWKNYRDTTTPT